ncbi:MAG: hypothetical protein DI596_04615 [Azospira oryzae]|nr:MAG: hypothetical protein DI596_04615 [Azospira oryzae]PZP81246.1 MAG: hypothetical protein DI593_04615 [Azospira oryzae]
MRILHESGWRIAGAGFEIRRRGDRWYWSLSKPCRLGSEGVASSREIALGEVRRRLAQGAAAAGRRTPPWGRHPSRL